MDPHLRDYIFRHYEHLMTEKEWLAHRHLFGTEKAARGRSDEAAQEDAKKQEPVS